MFLLYSCRRAEFPSFYDSVMVMNPTTQMPCPSSSVADGLSTGWSVKTHRTRIQGNQNTSLSEQEQDVIKQVIMRAEALEVNEQERVSQMVGVLMLFFFGDFEHLILLQISVWLYDLGYAQSIFLVVKYVSLDLQYERDQQLRV
uniref:RabBD domain-containing protein n=1 Tax=Timema monikensis TaxID=170555 RepID=A0A7R9EG70_9NEOP|nr:unnamed protein product [Timema monikensis]